MSEYISLFKLRCLFNINNLLDLIENSFKKYSPKSNFKNKYDNKDRIDLIIISSSYNTSPVSTFKKKAKGLFFSQKNLCHTNSNFILEKDERKRRSDFSLTNNHIFSPVLYTKFLFNSHDDNSLTGTHTLFSHSCRHYYQHHHFLL